MDQTSRHEASLVLLRGILLVKSRSIDTQLLFEGTGLGIERSIYIKIWFSYAVFPFLLNIQMYFIKGCPLSWYRKVYLHFKNDVDTRFPFSLKDTNVFFLRMPAILVQTGPSTLRHDFHTVFYPSIKYENVFY